MSINNLIAYLIVLTATGCASYGAVKPGPVQVGALHLDSPIMWNAVPNASAGYQNSQTRVWTQDGLLLNRIIIIPGVPDGKPIFLSSGQGRALPVFEADMLANEIEEMIESSIVKLFGEGQVAVQTEKLRPHRFGEQRGFMFDMTVAVSDGPDYRGTTGAFVHEEQLFLLIYLGADPYYYEKRREQAEALIKSARI